MGLVLLHGIHGIQPRTGHLGARLAQRSEVRGHVDVAVASLLQNLDGEKSPKPASFQGKKSEK